ncbi:MFS transporter [Ktedonospora formicarum]|uniref:MFS transporter n=1 Tax=Ktedonospora formicarum TaxID=2778364 RepID=A0A8J3I5N7_9CHLR|nr:MFS transporter [Ktedonospora formicarum]GHO46567.1 MFS transporter [Ktedonospora formicarum]
MSKWKDHFGFPETRGKYGFLLVLIVDAFGAGLFLPLSVLYFQVTANLPLPAIGLTLTIATVCTLPLSLITGNLVDRFGARHITAISQIIQAFGFLGYLFVHTLSSLFGTAFLVTMGSRVFFAASASLIVDIASPHERDRWFGLVGAIRNIGLGIGGFLAGFVMATNNPDMYHLLIGCSALCYLVAGCLLLRLPEPEQRHHMQVAKEPVGTIWQNHLFLVFLLCNVTFPLCALMLTIALPVYVTEAVHAPGWIPGSALMLNSLLIIGGQTLVVRILEPYRRTRSIGAAALTWGVSCSFFAIALLISRTILIPYLFLAVAIHTLASLLYGPAVSALIADLAPASQRGRYLATYEFVWGIASALAPALFSLLYVVTPTLPWILLVILISASGISMLWLERRLPARAVRANKPSNNS